MGKAAKLLLGLATAWQLVYAVLFTGTLLRVLLSGLAPPPGGSPDLPELTGGSGPALLLHAGTLLLMLALAAYYVAEAARSARVPRRWRALWVALNAVGGFLAQLPYWYAFIWREPEPEPLPTTLVRPGPPRA